MIKNAFHMTCCARHKGNRADCHEKSCLLFITSAIKASRGCANDTDDGAQFNGIGDRMEFSIPDGCR